jgi:Phosphate-selective porin O and P
VIGAVRVAGILAVLGGWAMPVAAQDSLLAELAHRFRSRPLSLGVLLQVVGEYQNQDRVTGPNGFRVPNFRLRLSGELDGGYGYLVQTNFAASPAILDAALQYRVAESLVLQAGQFKAPFSRELLTGAGDLDFVERSRVVAALAPARQLGVLGRGQVAGGRVEYAAGVFNGNGIGTGANDGGNVLGVGRLAWWPLGRGPTAPARLELAANFGYSHDSNVNLGPLIAGFHGRRSLWGLDARYETGRWLFAGEVIGARLAPSTLGTTTHPLGWQTTAGFHPTARLQLLVRWDAMRPDGLAADGDLLVAGLRAWPTGAIQFRLDDLIDVAHAELASHRVQAGAQVGF